MSHNEENQSRKIPQILHFLCDGPAIKILSWRACLRYTEESGVRERQK